MNVLFQFQFISLSIDPLQGVNHMDVAIVIEYINKSLKSSECVNILPCKKNPYSKVSYSVCHFISKSYGIIWLVKVSLVLKV
jgi:uncharacterized protein YwlG (UPF0340 family)